MVRKSRFSEEQIIAILREQKAGSTTAEVCRKHGISRLRDDGLNETLFSTLAEARSVLARWRYD